MNEKSLHERKVQISLLSFEHFWLPFVRSCSICSLDVRSLCEHFSGKKKLTFISITTESIWWATLLKENQNIPWPPMSTSIWWFTRSPKIKNELTWTKHERNSNELWTKFFTGRSRTKTCMLRSCSIRSWTISADFISIIRFRTKTNERKSPFFFVQVHRSFIFGRTTVRSSWLWNIGQNSSELGTPPLEISKTVIIYYFLRTPNFLHTSTVSIINRI